MTAADETVSGDLERLGSVPKSRSRLMKVDNSSQAGHRPVPTAVLDVLRGYIGEVGSLELRLEPRCRRPLRNITSHSGVPTGCLALNQHAEMAPFHPHGAAESRERVVFPGFYCALPPWIGWILAL